LTSKTVQSLKIKGFQSHVDNFFEFHPGFNVIVGPNNSGKSAVFRALRKVCFDDPLGGDFVNDGVKSCEIILRLSDDTEIVRVVEVKRDKEGKATVSTHYYKVDGEEYRNFGKSVPEEVTRAHGMEELAFGGTGPTLELNFQQQLDPPFLLMESAPYRAKALSLISGMDIIDKGISEINRRKKGASVERKAKEREITELEEELAGLPSEEEVEDFIEGLSSEIKQVESFSSDLDDLLDKRSKLEQVDETIEEAQREIKVLGEWVDQFNEVYDLCKEVGDELVELEKLGLELDESDQEIDDCNSLIGVLETTIGELDNKIDSLLEGIETCSQCGQELSEEAKGRLRGK